MVPPAPGLFSTITGWPSLADSSLDMARAMTSVALPGVKATMTCTGFSGHVSARVGEVTVPAIASATAAISRRMDVSPCRFSFGRYLAADAGHVQAAQDALTRGGELCADGGKVAPQQLAVALREPAGDQHVPHPRAAALHDDGGDGVMHRPHGERPERHDGDVRLPARRQAADAVAHAEHRRAARGHPVERLARRDCRGGRDAAAPGPLGGVVE